MPIFICNSHSPSNVFQLPMGTKMDRTKNNSEKNTKTQINSIAVMLSYFENRPRLIDFSEGTLVYVSTDLSFETNIRFFFSDYELAGISKISL